MKEIREKFDDVNIPREQFDDIVQIGAFNNNAPWEHVLSIAVSKISRVNSPPPLIGLLDWHCLFLLLIESNRYTD